MFPVKHQVLRNEASELGAQSFVRHNSASLQSQKTAWLSWLIFTNRNICRKVHKGEKTEKDGIQKVRKKRVRTRSGNKNTPSILDMFMIMLVQNIRKDSKKEKIIFTFNA